MMAESTASPASPPGGLNLQLIAAKAGDLPPMPTLAVQALQMTKDPKVSARDLQAVITRDQALTARILRVVNSAMFALRGEVATVSHAVAVLGMDAIRSIIMSASVQQVLQSGGAKGHDLGTRLLFDHSWGAASAARVLAESTRYPNAEEAFLCGLMHDIGKPILMRNFAGRYTQVMADVYAGRAGFHTLELQAFGFSHAHVGALVAERWNFPWRYSEAIGFHHDPLSASENLHLACITNLANSIMIQMEIGFEKRKDLDLGVEPAAEFLKLDGPMLDEAIVKLRHILADTASPPKALTHEAGKGGAPCLSK
jgi:putative nucleotidyltransferase with HDIG domain